MALPNHIKERREAFGISQAKLAERTDIPLITIKFYEQQRRTPNIYYLKRIAEVLKCHIEDLI